MASTLNRYDVIVIGGGPGGYTAAGRCAAAGLQTLLIEAEQLGGVCLNAGCIPTKTLLHSAKLFAQMQASAAFGIRLEAAPRLDWPALMQRKAQVIEKLRNGVRYQLRRRHVELITGYATFVDRQTVQVEAAQYSAPHIVIATGASPAQPDVIGGEALLNTTDLLALETLPASLAIVGSGPLALGLGSIFALLGVQVDIIGADEDLLPAFEAELVAMLEKALPPMRLLLGQRVRSVSMGGLHLSDESRITPERMAHVGERLPNIRGMGLEVIGLDVDGGCINVDEGMRTNLPGIYAVGDVTGLSMWAHTAQRMGEVVASSITGGADRFRLAQVPLVVYSEPQLAMVGLTEAQALEAGYAVRVSRLPLNYNGRYLAEHELDASGACKVVVDAQTQRLLGVHILGGNASEMIFGAAAMLADEFRVQDVQQVLFAHPTVAEVLKDTLYEL